MRATCLSSRSNREKLARCIMSRVNLIRSNARLRPRGLWEMRDNINSVCSFNNEDLWLYGACVYCVEPEMGCECGWGVGLCVAAQVALAVLLAVVARCWTEAGCRCRKWTSLVVV